MKAFGDLNKLVFGFFFCGEELGVVSALIVVNQAEIGD